MIDLSSGSAGAGCSEAALLHLSQVSPSAVRWRRLQLQGECEHLRWLVPPPAAAAPGG